MGLAGKGRDLGSRFCHPAHVQRASRFSRGAVGSGIIANLSVHTYRHGVLGIFFQISNTAIIKGDGQIFFLEESTARCHFSGSTQLLRYMNYVSRSLQRRIAFRGLCAGAAEESLLLWLVSAPPGRPAQLRKRDHQPTCSR